MSSPIDDAAEAEQDQIARPAAARLRPSRTDRFLMACLALTLSAAAALIFLNTVLWSLACLEDYGATSPYCDSRWLVLLSAVIVIPLIVLCTLSMLASYRAARQSRRLTQRELQRVITLFIILTLVGLTQPFGYVLVPFTWFVIGVFVLLVRGVAALNRSASSRR